MVIEKIFKEANFVMLLFMIYTVAKFDRPVIPGFLQISQIISGFSLQDIFYWFMRDRYIAEDVVFMAAHDFLSAIITFSETDKVGKKFIVGPGNISVLKHNYIQAILSVISVNCSF